MNTQQENIIVDSCQYTPVYLVQNTGAIQGRPYIVAQSNVEEAKPVSDNLKRFYESSGILENNFVNNVPTISKPRILKKQDSKHVGNNLKLASFLLPKGTQEPNLNKQCLSVNNVVLKQVVGGNVMNPVPKVEVVSANVVNTPQMEIVANMVNSSPKVELLTTSVMNNIPKVELLPANTVNNIPKVELLPTNVVNNIPKVELLPANVVNNIPKVELLPANVNNIPKVELVTTNVVNSASKVELITTNVVNCNTVPKVEVDRKIVKLKNFPNALRTPPRDKPKIRPRVTVEDSPNPNTNATKHTSVQLLKLGETYHSLNQLSDAQMKMVNQALKIFSNPEKTSKEPTYDPVTNTRFIYKVVSPRDLTVVGKNKIKKDEANANKKESKKVVEDPDPEPVIPVEVKMTRSGRKVKFPKQIVPDNTPPPKAKKKSTGVVSCFQCSTEFCSLYRLQKHYENQPTHLPAKVHSNLFHCLLAIIKSGSEEDRTNIFIQQLEQLIEKLRSLLPCLMKKIDGSVGKSCTINDDIGRLFGMNPGKYNLNTDALTCVKDKDGNCRHNPPPKNQFNSNLNKPSQLWLSKHNEEIANIDNGTEDCARINAVDKWPTANKRIRNSKQQKNMKSEIKAKKMRLSSENSEAIIELEDLVNFNTPNSQNAINVQPKSLTILDDIEIVNEPLVIKDERSTFTDLPKKTKSAPAQFTLSTPKEHSAINVQPLTLLLDNLHEATENCIEQPLVSENQSNVNEKLIKKEKGAHTQFHSAHFDIRSSPIKSSSAATFRKFQINFEKIGKFEVQKLDINETEEEESEPQLQECVMQPQTTDDSEDLNSLFRDDIVAMACKDPHEIPHDLNAFEATKDWICSGLNAIMEKSNYDEHKDDNFMKTNSLDESFIRGNSLIEPALLHLKEDTLDKLPISNDLTGDHLTDSDNRLLSNQSSSVLNFLDSLGSECLSYPETEIRNNTVDFQLDLFSFSNT